MANNKDRLQKIEKLIGDYRVTSGKKFKLKNWEPSDTHGLDSEFKDEAKELLTIGVEWLAELQDKLYAQDRWAVLCIFQAMDAAGKDSTIKHVMSGVNPQGCQVFSFKQPSSEDLDHDFMWRYQRCLPERGRIGIFNRSYYEEVLVVKVHEEILKAQKLPEKLVTKTIWEDRLEDIANFEKYLARNGVSVIKFYLHLSQEEQKKRFLARIEKPEKNWKFDSGDIKERGHWAEYRDAFEEAISATATPESPWYIIPADNKWFARLAVSAAMVQKLEGLDLQYPKVDKVKLEQLAKAKALLLSDKKLKQ
ncbi:MAG: polyphosphate kinase 2 family protein [Candidatus Obscuribacter sp.]|nr:polyphosphate kinase 2 family protein [Candidatus Obscuribacter sp.]